MLDALSWLSTAPGPLPLKWDACAWFRRLYFGTDSGQKLSFLLGSCLYPGAPFEQEMSDAVFAPMLVHASDSAKRRGVDHLILLGDQIYADATADLFDPGDVNERYRDRYRRAWGGAYTDKGQHAHRLFSHVPSYFVVDDHEIIENWNGRVGRGGRRSLYRTACRETWNYQMHHDRVVSSKPDGFWYDFNSAGFPFFVFDTRTERRVLPRTCANALLSDRQLQAFDAWLAANTDHIKNGAPLFICSGSPFGPVTEELRRFPALADGADNLLGYPGFLKTLHALFIKHRVSKGVWLSGDPHLSCYMKVSLGRLHRRVDILHVVASGLFAPLPFANDRPDAYAWEQGGTLGYSGTHLTVTTEPYLLTSDPNHFVRIDLSHQQNHWQATVEAFNVQGGSLKRMQITL